MEFENMNNFNDDGFNEARRIIEDARRFRPIGVCCVPNNNGVTGPTGPIGPTGPTGATGLPPKVKSDTPIFQSVPYLILFHIIIIYFIFLG